MVRKTLLAFSWATVASVPCIVGAQAATTPRTPPLSVAPGSCDCPEGDSRGELRNLAAFAPLGLLGALAAAGGSPGLSPRKFAVGPAVGPANGIAPSIRARQPVSTQEVAITERARNLTADPPSTDDAPSLNRATVPDPVSPDSLRVGIRAPNTATPLPSVFLLGSGLIAIGCVAVFRTRG